MLLDKHNNIMIKILLWVGGEGSVFYRTGCQPVSLPGGYMYDEIHTPVNPSFVGVGLLFTQACQGIQPTACTIYKAFTTLPVNNKCTSTYNYYSYMDCLLGIHVLPCTLLSAV